MVYDRLPLYRSAGRNRRYHGNGVVADHDELVYHHHTASASASSTSSSSSSSCSFASAVAAVVVSYTTKQQSAHDARECNTTENRLGVVVGVGDDRVWPKRAAAVRRSVAVGATDTPPPFPRYPFRGNTNPVHERARRFTTLTSTYHPPSPLPPARRDVRRESPRT